MDGQRYLAYTYSDESSDKGIYLGVQLLDIEDRIRVYNISAEAGGENGVEIDDNNGFTEIDKYKVLSGSKLGAGLGSGGTDVFQFVTAGPLSISPGNDVSVRFALHAARSLDSLKNQADQIFEYFRGMPPAGVEAVEREKLKIYPNPTDGQIYLQAEDIRKVIIRGMDGRTLIDAQPDRIDQRLYLMNSEKLKAGVYLIEVHRSHDQFIQKLMVKWVRWNADNLTFASN